MHFLAEVVLDRTDHSAIYEGHEAKHGQDYELEVEHDSVRPLVLLKVSVAFGIGVF